MRSATCCKYPARRRVPRHVLLGSLALIGLLVCAGCAQLPKQSVELSATVGRDIAQVYKAHRELAVLLFGRIKGDVNKFIDEVYAPFQIQRLLQADQEDFKNGEPLSLFYALDAATKAPDNPAAQETALQAMNIFQEVVREEIEFYRKERLAPVLAQEEAVLSAIDRSYNQIHYANSIVTGHLASILEVHDAQEELLREFGIEGLRGEIGRKLASTSNKVAEFVEKAHRVDGTIAEMETKINELTKQLDTAIGK